LILLFAISMKKELQTSEIILFSTTDEKISVDVRMQEENVWLSQKQMAEIFDCSSDNISLHLKNIFQDGELEEKSVTEDFSATASDGKNYRTKHYNLDAIIAVGYRVNSKRATQFRIWATKILKEYIIKGFAMDDERLKNAGGGNYWKELLERIRDIRSSEKVLYRQVLDLYATSIDYDPKSKESTLFFKTVQNKLHYAVNKQTAAELIYSRADAEKDFMGLSTFSGSIPTKKDISVAKNYLHQDEIFRLNRLVSAFFDLAEMKASEHKPMKMADWLNELDQFVKIYGKGSLENAGTISHEKALEKAEKEYRKYQAKTLSPVEKEYLTSIKILQKTVEKTHPSSHT
jgi:hypothetical protein